ncbi:TIGR03943 family putative permease subunit [Arthrobacter oryzae]|uniref:TIGR03943 family putative permease subunit n=1 Tax=Arthrobacter oryzae TaxID=409290 RepID=UPI00285C6FE2|nr:TIGR03943 family protein [Arthrobacter oryzae]MDR6504647.1 putative repeat protein (TIGR03943 family) [Arthrobacter oryzae]
MLLSIIGVVATLWLGFTGQLALYIHPRYFVFTIVMAVVAGLLALAAFALVPDGPHTNGHAHADGPHAHGDAHGHADGDARPGNRHWRRLGTAGSTLIAAAAVVGLLVLPPSTLSSATVTQRDLNGSASTLSGNAAAELMGADYAAFTMKDWISLLRQGVGEEFLAGKTATVTGFVTPDKSDPENVFFAARFVVTCCAVDAQPIGLPVYAPGWQDRFETDSWVTVSGGFRTNPSQASDQALVMVPDSITPVPEPDSPYVY